jgi:predicted DNA-binding protein
MDASPDAKTRAKLESLTTGFQRSRAAVLRQVLQWGLGQAGPIASKVPRRLTSFFFIADAELHQQVKDAAQAAGVDVAPWLRHMMRQVRQADFPKSWQAGTREKRLMLRLDDQARARLEELASHFDESQAAIIRQLIVQATLEGFPPSWHLAVGERRRRQRRSTS